MINNGQSIFKLSGFIITNKEGFKYYFGISPDENRSAISYEHITQSGTYNQSSGFNLEQYTGENFPTSWQLLDVISPTGGHIKFY